MDRGSWQRQRELYEQRQTLYWKDVEEGHAFEPFLFEITKDLFRELIAVTEDENPLYYSRTVVPQAAAVIFGRLALLGASRRPAPGGILTNLTFHFGHPIRLGDVITSRAIVTAKEERKGRKYFGFRVQSVNQHGETVLVMEQTGILPA